MLHCSLSKCSEEGVTAKKQWQLLEMKTVWQYCPFLEPPKGTAPSHILIQPSKTDFGFLMSKSIRKYNCPSLN